jgi:sulfur carrier protein
MKLRVNGDERDVDEGMTLADLIGDMGLGEAVCAAELNQRVVPRAVRAETLLADGDVVEVVTLVGGG